MEINTTSKDLRQILQDCDGLNQAEKTHLYEQFTACTDWTKRLKAMQQQLKMPEEILRGIQACVRLSQVPTLEWHQGEQPPVFEPRTHGDRVREAVATLVAPKLFQGSALTWWPKHMVPGAADSEWDSVPVSDFERAALIHENLLHTLRCIGGEECFIRHPNEDRMHCMQLRATRFHELLQSTVAELEELGSDKDVLCFRSPEGEYSEVLDALISCGVLVQHEDTLLLYPALNPPTDRTMEGGSQPSAVLCGGGGNWFGLHKPVMARLLMNGIDVLAFSYRGYEHSEGVPTDKRIVQDVATACHYLKTKRGILEEDLLLYAHCQGLGPAARYLSQHPSTALFIDRSYASVSTQARNMIRDKIIPCPRPLCGLAAEVSKLALGSFVHFESEESLSQATGKLALVTAEADFMVSEAQRKALRDCMPEHAVHISSPAEYDHSGNWLKDRKTTAQFEAFLQDWLNYA